MKLRNASFSYPLQKINILQIALYLKCNEIADMSNIFQLLQTKKKKTMQLTTDLRIQNIIASQSNIIYYQHNISFS